MKLSDKITIAIIVISVIVLGIFLRADALIGSRINIGGREMQNEKQLAIAARFDNKAFINETPQSFWYKGCIPLYDTATTSTSHYSTIGQPSAVCCYHRQSTDADRTDEYMNSYKVLNVIDIKWSNEQGKYNITNYRDKEGYENGKNVDLTNSNYDEAKLVMAINHAYTGRGLQWFYGEKVNVDGKEIDKAIDDDGEYDGYNKSNSPVKYLSYHVYQGKAEFLLTFYDTCVNGFLNSEINETFWKNVRQTASDGIGGINVKENEWADAMVEVKKESQNYRDDYKNFVENKINKQTTSKEIEVYNNGNTIIGPFRISKGQGEYGNVSKISVNADGKEIVGNSKEGKIFYSYTYGSQNETWGNDFSNIGGESEFYIKIEDNGEISEKDEIKIKFYQVMPVYNTRLMLIRPGDNGYGHTQNLAIYATDQEVGETSIEYDITGNVEPVRLTVNKLGQDREPQSNVKFYLTNKLGQNAYWVEEPKVVNDMLVYPKVEFKDWSEDANNMLFTTGKTGKFVIEGLSYLNTYCLEEKSNTNPGYYRINIKNISIANGEKSPELSATIAYAYTGNKNYIKNIKLSKENDNVLEIINTKEQAKEQFDINITKVAKGGKNSIPGAEFKIKVLDGVDFVGWLRKPNSKQGYEYNAEFDKATVWNSNSGKITIANLDKSYNYLIYETKAADNYELQNQSIANGMNVYINTSGIGSTTNIGYQQVAIDKSGTKNNLVFCGQVSRAQNPSGADMVIENVKNGHPLIGGGNINITINKVIKIDGKNGVLKDVGFKIRVLENNSPIGWLESNASGYKYTESYNNATTWTTDNNGKISILALSKKYSYKIYEVKTSEIVSLSEQTVKNGFSVTGISDTSDIGYGKIDVGNSNTEWIVYCGEIKTSSTVTVQNVHGKTNIEGIVWIDTDEKSKNNYNGLYDSWETVLSGLTVELRSKIDGVKNPVKTTKTDKSGKYRFENIDNVDLTGYYIALKYKDIPNRYRLTIYNSSENGNKAQEVEDGEAIIKEISADNALYMNIGLEEQKDADFEASKNIEKVTVKMKGKDYVYYYGKDNTGVKGVSKLKEGKYYRRLYSSDIAYSTKENVKDGLEVRVTYKIQIKNPTKNLKAYTINDVGKKRYEKMDVTIREDYNEEQYVFETSENIGWTINKGSSPTYTLSLEPQDDKDVYITLKLTNTALNSILDYGKFSINPSSHISIEHTYKICQFTRTELGYWKEYLEPCGTFDWVRHKWIHTGWKTNENWSENKTSTGSGSRDAGGIIFSIYEYDTENIAKRKISGAVFKDNANENDNDNGEKLGDGIYNSDEEFVKNVKVDLLDEKKEIATRYVYDKDAKTCHKLAGANATFTTNYKGYYEFEGMIPGTYYIRFTYGDGTQYIYSPTASDSNDNDGKEKVTAYNYKSTIVTQNSLKEIIKENKVINCYNTNSILNNKASKAIDDLNERENFNKKTNEETDITKKLKTYDIKSYTPKLEINIEGTGTKESNSQDVVQYDIKNMNFGIIEIPKTELGLELNMTNIKVTNTQGNIIIEGNPGKDKEGQNLKYLSNLDKENHIIPGSTYAKIEINNEQIYGAKLEITYAITIINNSDLNYYEDEGSTSYGDYYKFGDIAKDAKQVGIRIEQVKDYLDSLLKNSSSSIDLNNITGWKDIYTGKFEENKGNNTTTIEFTAYRNLSTKEERMNYDNQAVVTRIKTLGNNLITDISNYPDIVSKTDLSDNKEFVSNFGSDEIPYKDYFTYQHQTTLKENPTSVVSLNIIPPTGIGRKVEYIIIFIISGIVIIAGVIFIKKKVL